MQTTVHQHFVPRMYLKRWVHDGKDQLYVISKKLPDDEIHELSYDDNLFCEDYCYDVVSIEGENFTDNQIEHQLDKCEKKHNRLLDRIIDQCNKGERVLDKGTNRLSDFMDFVGLLTVRNPYNNMPLPVNTETGIKSAQEMADFLNYLTCDAFSLTSLKVISIGNNRNLLFQMAEQFKYFKNISINDIYFLQAPDGYFFITSDNPVFMIKQVFYVPLSPKYMAYILFDKNNIPSFEPNIPYVISKEYLNLFNHQHKRKDVYSLIGKTKNDLIETIIDR